MATPLFPLHTVLFPGAELPLAIFEPRYRAMMADVLGGDRSFAVAAITSGPEVGGRAETHPVGCLARVERVVRASDGTMNLVARGEARARILARLPDDPYPRAEIVALEEAPGEAAAEALAAARDALREYLAAVARVHAAEVEFPRLPDDPSAASHLIADLLRIELPRRQRLLEAPDASTRLRMAAEDARREAALLVSIGPPAGRSGISFSAN